MLYLNYKECVLLNKVLDKELKEMREKDLNTVDDIDLTQELMEYKMELITNSIKLHEKLINYLNKVDDMCGRDRVTEK